MAYGFADSGDINAQRNALALALMQQGISTPGSSLSFQDALSSDPASDASGFTGATGFTTGAPGFEAGGNAAIAGAGRALGSADPSGNSALGFTGPVSAATPSSFGDLVGSNNSAINTGGMTIGQPGFTVADAPTATAPAPLADAPTASAPAQTGLTSFTRRRD